MLQDSNLLLDITSKINKGCRRYYRDSSLVKFTVPRTWGVKFNRHLKFKALVKAQIKDEAKDAFRKASDRATFKALVKAVQNVY